MLGGLGVPIVAGAANGPPSAPTNAVASPGGSGSATVSFTVPANNGSPITAYEIGAYLGSTLQSLVAVTSNLVTTPGMTETAPFQPPATLALQSGSTYTFVVEAENSAGWSPASTQSNSIVEGAPSTSSNVVASPGASNAATVSFTVPPNNGSNITEYALAAYSGSMLHGVALATSNLVTTAGATETLTYSSTGQGILQAGSTYTFVVEAENSVGWSSPSTASNSILEGAPSTSSNVAASPGNAMATVSFTVPSNNGSTITGYVLAAYSGSTLYGAAVTTSTLVTTPGATETMTWPPPGQPALQEGTTYTFEVEAENSVGWSPLSAPSNAVTPESTYPTTVASSVTAYKNYIESAQITTTSSKAYGAIALTPGNTTVWPDNAGYAAAGLAEAAKATNDSTAEQDVFNYLSWYAGAENPTSGIVLNWQSVNGTWAAATSVGSVDTPPSMFFVAADDYWAATSNEANLSKLKTGFQGALKALTNDVDAVGLTEQNPLNNDDTAALMDNSESYGGFLAAQHVFTDIGDPADATTASNAATRLKNAVQTDLWNAQNPGGAGFYWAGYYSPTTTGACTATTCKATNWSNPPTADPMQDVWAAAWGLATTSETTSIMTNPAVTDIPWGNVNALVPSSGGTSPVGPLGPWGAPEWALQNAGQSTTSTADQLSVADDAIATNFIWPYEVGVVGELLIAAEGGKPVPST